MPRFVFVKKQVVQAPQYGVEPISLTVSRPQVRSGSVLNNGGGTYGFQLNWVAVANAVKYKVYRATSINGPGSRGHGQQQHGLSRKAPPTTYAQSLLYTHEGTMSNYILFKA
eukprot:tig00021586_g22688.t1